MRRRFLAALPFAALAGIALEGAEKACPGQAQGFQRLKISEFDIAYRWEPAELKVGQFFAAEVVDCSLAAAGPVDRIAIDATMPAHGHGMNYRPTAERIAAGHHRFTGLMLHMPGTWRFTFTLRRADIGIQLTHDIDLRR